MNGLLGVRVAELPAFRTMSVKALQVTGRPVLAAVVEAGAFGIVAKLAAAGITPGPILVPLVWPADRHPLEGAPIMPAAVGGPCVVAFGTVAERYSATGALTCARPEELPGALMRSGALVVGNKLRTAAGLRLCGFVVPHYWNTGAEFGGWPVVPAHVTMAGALV